MTVSLSALATALLGAWAARISLRPLRRMTELAGGVSAQSLTTRLPVSGLPPELGDLGQSLNAMLERLEAAFERLSAFSADIAHELRTPLSNLLTHTQVTLTRPRTSPEYEEALHSNLEDLQHMAQLVNDMLYLAKAEHGLMPAGREPLRMEAEVDALLEFSRCWRRTPRCDWCARVPGRFRATGACCAGRCQPAGQCLAVYAG